MVIIELADFSSIVAFADRAEREPQRLNILAGMVRWEHEQVEGWERTKYPRSWFTHHSYDPKDALDISQALSHPETGHCCEQRALLDKSRYFDHKLLDVLIARSLQLHILAPPTITANSVNLGLFFEADLQKEDKELCLAFEAGSGQLVYGAVGTLDDKEKLHGKCIQMSEVVEESDFPIGKGVKIV
ncbi:hypothetical protein ARMGADRAFT_1121586 [Armillaria gallica]|uniref:Uncharacterized protein n=1 Tax=Armillaria gallica TaxID=47427 RepID=A0A2H3D1F6_ARMGA|nr:hypothetical protein ARMGADRAFT_1121586 [Armillaria gallica]